MGITSPLPVALTDLRPGFSSLHEPSDLFFEVTNGLLFLGASVRQPWRRSPCMAAFSMHGCVLHGIFGFGKYEPRTTPWCAFLRNLGHNNAAPHSGLGERWTVSFTFRRALPGSAIHF